MTTGDADRTEERDDLAVIRERVAAAPRAADIQDLADVKIAQIRDLADRATAKARQVEELMSELSRLLGERDSEQS